MDDRYRVPRMLAALSRKSLEAHNLRNQLRAINLDISILKQSVRDESGFGHLIDPLLETFCTAFAPPPQEHRFVAFLTPRRPPQPDEKKEDVSRSGTG